MTRDRNLQYWGKFSIGIVFTFLSRYCVQISKEIAPKGVQITEIPSRKIRRILSRLWLSWVFFGAAKD